MLYNINDLNPSLVQNFSFYKTIETIKTDTYNTTDIKSRNQLCSHTQNKAVL